MSNPRREKYATHEEYYFRHGTVDKAIPVVLSDKDNLSVVLENGYCRYLVLVNQQERYVPVRFMTAEEMAELEESQRINNNVGLEKSA
jgi:hypothetical protein